jgi:hypothetical protein
MPLRPVESCLALPTLSPLPQVSSLRVDHCEMKLIHTGTIRGDYALQVGMVSFVLCCNVPKLISYRTSVCPKMCLMAPTTC